MCIRLWRRRLRAVLLVVVSISIFTPVQGELGPDDVLILVNQDSPTSRYIARLYREYYPGIDGSQVLSLSGLTDCSGPTGTPADEILTRNSYHTLIAQPVRDYLLDPNCPDRITQIKLIITTAGMPYRIEDTDPSFGAAIYPAGSNSTLIGSNENVIDAASVESELTCLWTGDWGSNPFGIDNRLVNPYQAYRDSPVDLFSRDHPDSWAFTWGAPFSFNPGEAPPIMEGMEDTFGTSNRQFHVGHYYLVVRLDGPKVQGDSAIFSVRKMLERARRASSGQYGVNPDQAMVLLDDAPLLPSPLDQNRVYNLTGKEGNSLMGSDYWFFDPNVAQPPDAIYAREKRDFVEAYIALTDVPMVDIDYILNYALTSSAHDLVAVLDFRNGMATRQADLETVAQAAGMGTNPGLILWGGFGVNGQEGLLASYILDSGPGGSPRFNLVNGAVFTSLESFNAVTLFSDVSTSSAAQGKLVDFLAVGGTGAIGYTMEPQTDAAVDNEFLFYNLLADSDDDGRADLTFAEAAYTAMPYLSWGYVVLGDPLMRLAYGPGEGAAWEPMAGDVNRDGRVNLVDLWMIKKHLGGQFDSSDPDAFDRYSDMCDVNKDEQVNYADLWLAKSYLGQGI